MSDNIPLEGYIYLIKMCDTNNRTIYKVGRTIDFYRRYNDYNYAKLLCVINSKNIINDKHNIVNLFNVNFILDKGTDFFLAPNDNVVMKIFLEYFYRQLNL